MNKKNSKKKIFNLIVRDLGIVHITALIICGVVCSAAVYYTTLRSVAVMLKEAVLDVGKELYETVEESLLNGARAFPMEISMDNEVSWGYDYLKLLADANIYTEINVLNDQCVIIGSNKPELVGLDLTKVEHASGFLRLADDEQTHVEMEIPAISGGDELMDYAGAPLQNGEGFLLIGMDNESIADTMKAELSNFVSNRHIGENGFMFICTPDGTVIGSYKDAYDYEHVPVEYHADGEIEVREHESRQYLVLAEETLGFTVIGLFPTADMWQSVLFMTGMAVGLLLIVFILLMVTLSRLMKSQVVDGIVGLNHSLSDIIAGNLDGRADIRTSLEFSSLSDDINATVDSLKGFIAREAARIDQDLAVAREIQQSTLPSVFPPFPDRKDFFLYASMDTAKEVGGDFYDFYFLDENELVFLIADVSGKGIPAAMFMMEGKTNLRNYAEQGNAPAEVVSRANEKLSSGNEAGMFITLWMGFLNTDTGLVRFINAGHNPPVLIRDGKAEFLKQKANLILATFEWAPYREQTLQLQPGDMLFLYTDGVTEAINSDEELYGEERLLEVLSGIDIREAEREAHAALATKAADEPDAVRTDKESMTVGTDLPVVMAEETKAERSGDICDGAGLTGSEDICDGTGLTGAEDTGDGTGVSRQMDAYSGMDMNGSDDTDDGAEMFHSGDTDDGAEMLHSGDTDDGAEMLRSGDTDDGAEMLHSGDTDDGAEMLHSGDTEDGAEMFHSDDTDDGADMNSGKEAFDPGKYVCRRVKEDLDRFVGKADQFDDITMVCLCYTGKEHPDAGNKG